MEIIIGTIVVLALAYVLIAAKMKLWPWASKVIGSVKGSEQAIIDTLRMMTIVEGTTVFSRTALPEEVKQGIIAAFDERVTKARTKGWYGGFNAKYRIYVYPSVRDTDPNGNYSPCFQVFLPPGDPYIGSEYDKGGYILAAERVLTDGNGNPENIFIIAENTSKAYTERVVSYALDHLFAWHNDKDLYYATVDHSKGGGHPLW